MERTYAVYILASRRNGTLYTGVTGDIAQRVHLHKAGKGGAFTRKYGVHQLVHVETFAEVHDAIAREKAIKKWRRAWKLQLIERDNPSWRDLSSETMP
jgi:putative endonuclease